MEAPAPQLLNELDTAAPAVDDLYFYATRDDLVKFSNDDITNQQLVDSLILFLNGSRVAISLTQ